MPAPSALTALSPLDGRYAKSAHALRPFFSEFGLIRYRVRIELEWLKALAAEPAVKELKRFERKALAAMDRLVERFSERDAEQIKNIEAETNHDVKAIEYWLKGKLGGAGQDARAMLHSLEFIHFACTSEDINNLAYALMLADSRAQAMLPQLDALIAAIRALAHGLADAPMLAHPRPAGLADHARQGDGEFRAPPAPRAQAHRRRVVAGQGKRRGRQLQRALRRLSRSGLGASGAAFCRDAGAGVQSLHHPDRAARFVCRAVRRLRAAPTPFCSTSTAICGATSRSAISGSA